MNAKKFAIIIHRTNEDAWLRLIDSLENLEIPEGYDVEILPVEGDERFFTYQKAMEQSDAKYKLYLDENVIVQDKNILYNLLEIFQSDEKIGLVGVSGAIELSTHGICWLSTKRCGKVYFDDDKKIFEVTSDSNSVQDVEAVDGFFMATQYDVAWRHDLFHRDKFGDTAQCIEFRRMGGGYKTVVASQETPWIWYLAKVFQFEEEDRQTFLDEYSKDIFPLVSVIILTFNRPEYFQEALKSAMNQTYRNIEIVITDDSTNDETEKIIPSYLAADSRIKYFRHKGFTANDNWTWARRYNNPEAEYVNWLLDDDLFYPRKLEIMVETYRNNPDVSLVTSKRNFIDQNGQLLPKTQTTFNSTIKMSGEKAGKLLFIGDNYIGELTTVLIKKKFLNNNNILWLGEAEKATVLFDVSTYIQLLTKGNFIWINEPLSACRNHLGQDTFAAGSAPKIIIWWTKYLKVVLDRGIFLETDFEIRAAFIHWMKILSLKLKESHASNYEGAEISILEECYIAIAKALRNDYKLDLPQAIYLSDDAAKTDETDMNLLTKKLPLVSVIIPTFNRPEYFKTALESALNQTYRNIEVIVSDNSTNDETENLIQSYLIDPRIKYFHHKNFTANDNWNWARHYNNPEAEYVNWLMDDDLFYPRKLEVMLVVYQENPNVSLVTSNRDYIDEHNNLIYKSSQIFDKSVKVASEYSGKQIFTMQQTLLARIDSAGNTTSLEETPYNYIGGLTNVLIRKKFLRENDLCYFDEEKGFYPCMDVSTWLQLLSNGDLAWIDETLSAVRLHSAQATTTGGNSAIVAMCWAKLIKYCWEKKIFLKTEADVRDAFINWINTAAMMFNMAQGQNYHGHEVIALEDLNIAMAEALHGGYKIILPPSVQSTLEKFK